VPPARKRLSSQISAPGTRVTFIFALLEKGGLSRILIGVSKVTQPHADEPVAL
jgi:hypothetical protein